MNLLDSVDSPADIKKLNRKELEELCSEVREKIIASCALNPGHIGASLGTVELSIALHYVLNTPTDKIIWDVGHQSYAHKIITGRKDAFDNKRRYGGISGFPKMSESEYDAFGTGHSSTSISAALGMAVGADLQGKKEKIVAVIGDGSIGGGMAFEALNHAGALKNDLLVILNDNKISIDKNTGALHKYLLGITTSVSYNKLKDHIWKRASASLRRFVQKFMFSTKMAFLKGGKLFESLGFRYFGPIDGHNVELLIKTLSKLKDIPGPKLLHIITVKGKGYKPAEENQVTWHAPGTFEKSTGKRTNKKNGDISLYQDVFGETLLELARKNSKIVGITPAMLTGSSLNFIMNEMPERTFDVGIAEQHAVTFSAGLAAEGMLPYCAIYSSFMQRAYDSIIHDVALQNLKVVFALDRAGLVGEDGATHHGAYDLAYFRTIPNITITAPINELELRNMLYSASLPSYGVTSIRYPRGYGIGIEWKGKKFEYIEPGKAQKLLPKTAPGTLITADAPILADTFKETAISTSTTYRIAILSIGTITNKVLEAIEQIDFPTLSTAVPIVYNMRFLKPIDIEAIEDACSGGKTIITVEDGTIIGGLHSAVSEYIAEKGYCNKIIPIAIPDRFVEHGTISELQTECGLNTEDIKKTILEAIE